MKKQKKLKRWLRDQLNNKWRQGYGRKKNKGIHNETPYIHSETTFKTYLSQCNHFADWCLQFGVKDSDRAYKMVSDYIKHLIADGKSAHTISTALCAISKAYGVSTEVFDVEIPKRERSELQRSRYIAKRDKHFSVENNQALITIVSCSGLRRHELAKLHGNQLQRYPDGGYFIANVKGKGGKVRNIDLIGTDKEIKAVVKLMTSSKGGLVFPHIHSAFDEHYYRSVYACRAYQVKARALETLSPSEKYICRKDKKGVIYDKKAMLYASNQLGHNRIDVIAQSYLYNLG